MVMQQLKFVFVFIIIWWYWKRDFGRSSVPRHYFSILTWPLGSKWKSRITNTLNFKRFLVIQNLKIAESFSSGDEKLRENELQKLKIC